MSEIDPGLLRFLHVATISDRFLEVSFPWKNSAAFGRLSKRQGLAVLIDTVAVEFVCIFNNLNEISLFKAFAEVCGKPDIQ